MTRLLGFLDRLGGMLVAPRRTLEEARDSGQGGLGDLVVWLSLQVLAVHLSRLAVAFLYIFKVSYSSGVSMLLNTIADAVWVPLAAVLVSALCAGQLTKGRPGRARALDLCCLAGLPPIALQLGASLAVALAGVRVGRELALSVLVASGLWFLALSGLAIGVIRRGGARSGASRASEP
jgi:hypothetical protein